MTLPPIREVVIFGPCLPLQSLPTQALTDLDDGQTLVDGLKDLP